MSYGISFVGAASGERFVERRQRRSKGFGFPPTQAKDALFSMGVDSARTMAGDPTSSVTGGATQTLVLAQAAIMSIQTLYNTIWFRLADSNSTGPATGSMLITVRKSRTMRRDQMDQQNFFFGRNTARSSLVALVDFLDKNDLSYTMPYSDLVELFVDFSKKCRGRRFLCTVEFQL